MACINPVSTMVYQPHVGISFRSATTRTRREFLALIRSQNADPRTGLAYVPDSARVRCPRARPATRIMMPWVAGRGCGPASRFRASGICANTYPLKAHDRTFDPVIFVHRDPDVPILAVAMVDSRHRRCRWSAIRNWQVFAVARPRSRVVRRGLHDPDRARRPGPASRCARPLS